MKGILLLSHGDMAKGMLQSSSLFYGDTLEQVASLGFQESDNPDDFEMEIGKKLDELDCGDGVIVLCDLFAGTPAHKTTHYLQQKNITVLCGMNFPMFLELLNLRAQENEVNLEALMEVGKEGIKKWEVIKENNLDDFY